jgi:cell division protein FtsW
VAKRAWMARRRSAPAQQPLEHRILWTATLCLLAAGAVMVYSASSARTLLQGQGDGTGYLVKYVIYGGVGLVAMQLLARTGLDAVRRVTGPLLVAAFVMLVAVRIPHIGIEVNGARRWLGAGPLQFQPSELMKLALLLYAVRVLAEKPKRARSVKGIVNPLGVVVGAALLLVASQPDLGTALVIAFTMTAVLVAAGVPLRFLAIGAGVGILVVGLFAIAEPYRRARLTTFVDPWSHANGAGFQAVQGQIAIGSGGLTGRGLGASIEKVFFLPEAHTDFILAVIGEELGVLGVWALLFLYGLVGYGGLQAARRARGAYAALLATGITALILSQALLNVFAVLGLAPLTGVPLPFVSSGSSSLLVLLAGMGLLLNVAGGGQAHLRAVSQGSRRGAKADPHRGRGNSGARRAGAGGRRRAAG